MWCESCSQEVPGVARPGNRELIVCPRCEQPLLRLPEAITPAHSSEPEPPVFEAIELGPLLESVWEHEAWAAAERDADRLLRSAAPPTPTARQSVNRVDGGQQAGRPHLNWPAGLELREDAAARAFDSAKFAVFLGAVGLLLGGAAVVFGDSWEQSTWRISGMVAAAVSQLLIVAGGLGLLMAMWRMHRVTRERVARLDREVAELQKLSLHIPPRDEAIDPSSDTLLLVDNMRRQLDRLAQRVRDERAA